MLLSLCLTCALKKNSSRIEFVIKISSLDSFVNYASVTPLAFGFSLRSRV